MHRGYLISKKNFFRFFLIYLSALLEALDIIDDPFEILSKLVLCILAVSDINMYLRTCVGPGRC